MKASKFTLIILACLLYSFAHAQKDKYVTFKMENPASHIIYVYKPSKVAMEPRTSHSVAARVGEQIAYMKGFKKHPLFVVTPDMGGTIIDVKATAKLRNKGDTETVAYIRPPRKKVTPRPPVKKQAVPPPPSPAIMSETVERPQLSSDEDEIFTIVQDMPRFPGCENIGGTNNEKKKCSDKKMLEYIYTRVKYPSEARKKKIEGTAMAAFVVEKDGSITNAKLKRDLGGGCGKEFLRVINSMPRWMPGRQRNQPVRVQLLLPMKFKLEG